MLGCRLLRLLAAPLPTPGTSSSCQTPSGRRSRPLSRIYEDNLAEKGDKRDVDITLCGVSLQNVQGPKKGGCDPEASSALFPFCFSGLLCCTAGIFLMFIYFKRTTGKDFLNDTTFKYVYDLCFKKQK